MKLMSLQAANKRIEILEKQLEISTRCYRCKGKRDWARADCGLYLCKKCKKALAKDFVALQDEIRRLRQGTLGGGETETASHGKTIILGA